MKIMSSNRIAPDGTAHFAASHLGLFCLPMSHNKDARLIWVKTHSIKHACGTGYDSTISRDCLNHLSEAH